MKLNFRRFQDFLGKENINYEYDFLNEALIAYQIIGFSISLLTSKTGQV